MTRATNRKGFTLIELLVVIGILGVLAAVIMLVLNPVELLRQGRDSIRLSDLQTINKALGFLEADSPPSAFFGLANTIYVSIPDTSAVCANLGLPTLPTSWSYACATSANFRRVDSTGWIPINFTTLSSGPPFSKLPVDPVNATSTDNYYTYITGGSWKLRAVLESQKYSDKAGSDGGTVSWAYETGSDLTLGSTIFPSYWVKVPGNSSFGTSNFLVMKYEVKCVETSTNAPLTSPDTGGNTYNNSSQPCTGGSYYIASAPTGYPIANISHDTAKTYCSNIGAHLLTNDEWMTIARDAEQAAGNWTNGSVGSGALYSGHNDNDPANALTASADDALGYTGTGNTSPSDQKRTFSLSNGSVVWDIPGNVWEHVQRSTMNSGDAINTMALPACSDGAAEWGYCEYGSSLAPYVSSWTADVIRNSVGPSDTSWNSDQRVGKVITYKSGVNQGSTVFTRGGDWSNGLSILLAAGAFELYVGWGAGTNGLSTGFRCTR